jgi:hypothetical protein
MSLKITDAATYKAYAEKFAPELLTLLHLGFETSTKVTAHANVKGRKVLTEMIMGNLVKRWKASFDKTDNAVEFVPRVLSTELVKVDLEIYPQEFEGSYLAEMMKPGQNPTELPFQKYILEKILAKKAEEDETAVWTGEAEAIPGALDPLAQVIDGFMTIAKEEASSGNITAVATGALSDTNAVEKFESVYLALHESVKKGVVDIWCSNAAMTKYIRDYRTRYGGNTITAQYMQFDLGTVRWNVVPGVGDFIMMTPKENLHYGFDGAADGNTIRFEASKRAIALMMDYRIGVQIGIVDNKILRINDQ